MIETNIVAGHVDMELIHERCNGCGRVTKDSTCSTYQNPPSWWRRGRCPLADHLKIKVVNNGKIRVGQQKQTKKNGR